MRLRPFHAATAIAAALIFMVSGAVSSTEAAKPKDKGRPGTVCNTGAECLSDRCSRGICVPQDGAGQLNDVCLEHKHCASTFCSPDEPYMGKRANLCKAVFGDACANNGECASARCDRGEGNARRCIPNDGTGGPGDYCTHPNHCKGRNCMQNKCVAAAEPGQPCATNASCASNRCDMAAANQKLCIPNDGTGRVGEYCSHNNQCTNRNCVDSKCRAQVGTGQVCVTNASCESNRCDMAPGNPRKCIPNDRTGAVGEYCTHNNQCVPGRACAIENGKRFGSCR